MVRTRQAKVDRIAATIPPLEVDDPAGEARLLVLGWGGTYGSIGAAVRRARREGYQVAQAHLRHLNPFPSNLGEVLRSYDKVLVPEINLGQLALLLRGKFLVDVISYNRVRGLPFRAAELAEAIEEVLSHDENEEYPERHTACGSLDPGAQGAAWRPRTSSPTRRFAGAPAAVTTRSSRPSSRSSPSSRCRGRTWRWSPASAARPGCRTTVAYGMHSIHGRAPAIATGLPRRGRTCRSG